MKRGEEKWERRNFDLARFSLFASLSFVSKTKKTVEKIERQWFESRGESGRERDRENEGAFRDDEESRSRAREERERREFSSPFDSTTFDSLVSLFLRRRKFFFLFSRSFLATKPGLYSPPAAPRGRFLTSFPISELRLGFKKRKKREKCRGAARRTPSSSRRSSEPPPSSSASPPSRSSRAPCPTTSTGPPSRDTRGSLQNARERPAASATSTTCSRACCCRRRSRSTKTSRSCGGRP